MTPPLDPKKTQSVQKPQLQLIPPALNKHLAAALLNGSLRYGPWNWRVNKVELMTYIGAMRRHLDALLDGEDIAQDSGCSPSGPRRCLVRHCARRAGTRDSCG